MKQKLFIRKENGRYEEYKEPPCEDNKLYIKRNGKYEPCGMELKSDYLNEGVWVITRNKSCRSFSSGKYLRDVFSVDKCSNLEKLTLGQLGTLNKLINEAFFEVKDEKITVFELFEKRVGYVIDKLMEQ